MLRIIKKIFRKLPKTAEELRKCGATIGNNFHNYSTDLDMPFIRLLTVGDNVTFSFCRIIFHDASTKRALGYSKIGKVIIGDNVFVGAYATILGGVKIGSNVIIGACSVVTKDIPANSVVAGNPAHVISTYDAFIEKQKNHFSDGIIIETFTDDKIDVNQIFYDNSKFYFTR